MAEREDTTATVSLTFEEAIIAFGGPGRILACPKLVTTPPLTSLTTITRSTSPAPARRFGWEPKRSLRDTLRRMVAALKVDPLVCYRENTPDQPSWLEKIATQASRQELHED